MEKLFTDKGVAIAEAELRRFANMTPPICIHERKTRKPPYCKPFEQFQECALVVLDLVVNRQRAEIERLERLNGDLVKIADTRKKANFSLLSEKLSLTREMRVAKVEAIKEFVEAFKVKFAKERYRDNYVIDDEMLDNLVKEMVGE